MFECCDKQRIKSDFLERDPTTADTQIDSYTLVVNTKTGDLSFKTKDGNGNPKINKLSGGGGGGDGIQTINGKNPDSSGNYQITSSDIPTASESQAGVAPLASSDETIKGEVQNKIVTPKTLSDKLGDQTQTYFGIGKGKDKPIEWAPISSDTIDYSYDPINKKIMLNVKNPTQSNWNTVRMREGDFEEYAVDKTIYITDRANGASTIGLKDNAEYEDHTEIEVYSLRYGFQITAENPEKDEVQIRYMDKFSTKGTGSLKSPNYGNPNDNLSWVKLTFYKELGLWITQYYSSTEFEVT